MIFEKLCTEAFDERNISNDIHEMNDHIKSLLVNAPPSHEIPFEVLQDIRRKGGGLLAFQQYSEKAKNMQVNYGNHEVKIRIFNHDTPDFVYLHIHGGGHCIGAADMQDQSLEKISNDLNWTSANLFTMARVI